MPALTSTWSRYVNRLFGTSRGIAPLRRADRRLRRREQKFVCAAADVLESRAMLSAPSLASAVTVGSTGIDMAKAVTTDSAGNKYVTGAFSGTVNFNPNGTNTSLTATGTTSAFVAKYAPDNTLVWVRQMGGNATASGGYTDAGQKITVDGSGNVYVAGDFMDSSASFGSTILSTAGGRDGFVTKLDANGTFQWARRWGTSGTDYGEGIGVDASGNVYAIGGGLGNGNGYTILKFNSAGSAVWSESIVANPPASDMGFAVDATGNVFLAGGFQGTVDFDPSSKTHYASSGPNYSGFVEKLNTNGKFQWVSPFVGQTVGNGYSSVESLALDGSSNIVVAGWYGGSVDFDPGAGTTILSASHSSGFITKLNSSGGLIWAEALQASSSAFVRGLAVDSAGNIYATGNFGGTIALNPSDSTQTWTTPGGSGTFVVKLDAAGNFGWAEVFGGTGTDNGFAIGFGIAVETNGSVDVVGDFQHTVNFNPDPNAPPDDVTSAGGYDAFILQLNQS